MFYIFRWTSSQCKVIDIELSTKEADAKVLQHGQNDETPRTDVRSVRMYYAKTVDTFTPEEQAAVNEFIENQKKLIIMDTIQANAIDLLKQLMQQRNWHNGIMPAKTAAAYKSLLKKNKLSYSRACRMLYQSGWQRTQHELWMKK